VLHSRGKVAPETAGKIDAVLEKHPFTPNIIARQLKKGSAYRFSVVLPARGMDSGYWDQAKSGIQEVSSELAFQGIRTKMCEFESFSPDSFGRIMQDVLEEKPDGVIIAPIFPREVLPFAEKMQDAGIPYVYFDSDLPGTEPICTIATDPRKGGYLAGRLLHLFAGDITGRVAVQWAPLNSHISLRKEGFLRYAAEYGFEGQVKLCPDKDGVYLPDDAIEASLGEMGNLKGIFIAYADVELAARLFEARRKQGGLFIVGYDLVPANYSLLKEGKIDAIISQRSREQGREAMFSLYRYIVLGWKIEDRIEIPLDIYFRENLPDEYPPRSYRREKNIQ
jgi:LacI family transcriptional regulator